MKFTFKFTKKQFLINIIILIIICSILITMDQLTKQWAFKHSSDYYYKNTFVGVRLITNTGMFGSMGDKLGFPIVQSITSIIAILIFTVALFSKKWYLTIGLTIMFSGSMGNIIDRYLPQMTGYDAHSVRDWIFTPWTKSLENGGTYNIADVQVMVGAVLLFLAIFISLFKDEKQKKHA